MRLLSLRAGLAAAGFAVVTVAPAVALEEPKDERDNLKVCELRLCKVVTRKEPKTGDFSCPLSKTWARERLKEGSAEGKLTWGYGDARCSVALKLDNAKIVESVSAGSATLQFPEHTVECMIEHAAEKDKPKEAIPMKFTLAPKVTFKDGKAEKIWVNLRHSEGPKAMTALAYSVAKLEDKLGIFHTYLIKAVNHMIIEKCPRVVAESK